MTSCEIDSLIKSNPPESPSENPPPIRYWTPGVRTKCMPSVLGRGSVWSAELPVS